MERERERERESQRDRESTQCSSHKEKITRWHTHKIRQQTPVTWICVSSAACCATAASKRAHSSSRLLNSSSFSFNCCAKRASSDRAPSVSLSDADGRCCCCSLSTKHALSSVISCLRWSRSSSDMWWYSRNWSRSDDTSLRFFSWANILSDRFEKLLCNCKEK